MDRSEVEANNFLSRHTADHRSWYSLINDYSIVRISSFDFDAVEKLSLKYTIPLWNKLWVKLWKISCKSRLSERYHVYNRPSDTIQGVRPDDVAVK